MQPNPQISAIISEYNPFHFGHAHHIAETRRQGATHIISILSGSFVQRGEPAMFSKWARTKMALLCGVDLVLELPLPWAMASAERFAFGGVSLANALGCVDTLSFGSECGELPPLRNLARAMDSPALMEETRSLLNNGMTFAKARELAAGRQLGEEAAGLLRSPNNTLAVEYLKALNRTRSGIRPMTIARKGAMHDSVYPEGGIASASYIRELLCKGDSAAFDQMPKAAAACANEEWNAGYAPAQIAPLERAVLAKLRTMELCDLQRLPDISEGLEHRIYRAARNCTTLSELYENIKTKRYTLARIRRIIVSAFLGLDNLIGASAPPYIRVLGFSSGRGEELLRRIKQSAQLPLVVRPSDILSLGGQSVDLFQLESRATDLYGLTTPQVRPCGLDYTTPLIKISRIL